MFKSIFEKQTQLIDGNCDVIVVADLFVEDYVGGAELTTQALIDESSFVVQKIKSQDLTIEHLKQGHKKYWIFGNFANINSNLIPTIVANLSYSILEYDFKYCKFRSPEKHKSISGSECDCHDQINGKMIS